MIEGPLCLAIVIGPRTLSLSPTTINVHFLHLSLVSSRNDTLQAIVVKMCLLITQDLLTHLRLWRCAREAVRPVRKEDEMLPLITLQRLQAFIAV